MVNGSLFDKLLCSCLDPGEQEGDFPRISDFAKSKAKEPKKIGQFARLNLKPKIQVLNSGLLNYFGMLLIANVVKSN